MIVNLNLGANRTAIKLLVLSLATMLFFASCGSKKIITDVSKHRNKSIPTNLKARYAVLLDVNEREIKNEKLYRFIDTWLGVPHRDAGMNKNGIDCSGFTVLLQKEIYNQNLPRVAKQMADQVKRKYEDELQEGDLVFFDFAGRKFSHVGIFLKNNKFVHVSTSRGVIISDMKDSWYYKYFSRGGSIKD